MFVRIMKQQRFIIGWGGAYDKSWIVRYTTSHPNHYRRSFNANWTSCASAVFFLRPNLNFLFFRYPPYARWWLLHFPNTVFLPWVAFGLASVRYLFRPVTRPHVAVG